MRKGCLLRAEAGLGEGLWGLWALWRFRGGQRAVSSPKRHHKLGVCIYGGKKAVQATGVLTCGPTLPQAHRVMAKEEMTQLRNMP